MLAAVCVSLMLLSGCSAASETPASASVSEDAAAAAEKTAVSAQNAATDGQMQAEASEEPDAKEEITYYNFIADNLIESMGESGNLDSPGILSACIEDMGGSAKKEMVLTYITPESALRVQVYTLDDSNTPLLLADIDENLNTGYQNETEVFLQENQEGGRDLFISNIWNNGHDAWRNDYGYRFSGDMALEEVLDARYYLETGDADEVIEIRSGGEVVARYSDSYGSVDQDALVGDVQSAQDAIDVYLALLADAGLQLPSSALNYYPAELTEIPADPARELISAVRHTISHNPEAADYTLFHPYYDVAQRRRRLAAEAAGQQSDSLYLLGSEVDTFAREVGLPLVWAAWSTNDFSADGLPADTFTPSDLSADFWSAYEYWALWDDETRPAIACTETKNPPGYAVTLGAMQAYLQEAFETELPKAYSSFKDGVYRMTVENTPHSVFVSAPASDEVFVDPAPDNTLTVPFTLITNEENTHTEQQWQLVAYVEQDPSSYGIYPSSFRFVEGAPPETPTVSSGAAAGQTTDFVFADSDSRYLTVDDFNRLLEAAGSENIGVMLGVARNEIYARHGNSFDTPRYQEYFGQFGWYEPTHKVTDSELNEYEKANIQTIVGWEKTLS